MLTPGDDKIAKLPAEHAEIMLFLRKHLLSNFKNIIETFKYMTIFYEYKSKGICYMHQKDDYVYLGFTGKGLKPNKKLVSEGRKTIKIFKCFINEDIDVKSLNSILKNACALIDKKLADK